MQLSERYRRAVLMPLDDTTESQMRCGDVATSTCVKALSIDGDPFFYAIGETGVFAALNSACGTAIADYEEEIIEHCTQSWAGTRSRLNRADGEGGKWQYRGTPGTIS